MRVARQWIKKWKEEINNTKEHLVKCAKISSGDHAKAGTNRLGRDTLDLMRERKIEKELMKEECLKIIRLKRKKALADAAEILRQENRISMDN